MNIELNHIKIRNLIEGYSDNGEEGVVAFAGKLDVRPKYQREFIYKDKQRDAVIETVRKGFPLNIMYWVKTGEDSYEILDGQQRSISICSYVKNEYTIDYKYFRTLQPDEQNAILDYELLVYICEGTDSEKLEWFKTVNIAGEKLTEQELRNAVYAGTWLSDAKRHFSRSNAPAASLADGYMKGSPLRQEYLEQALKWISNRNIEEYMADHQDDLNANELWLYYRSVIDWVKVLFPTIRRKIMNGIEWGLLYNDFKDNSYDSDEFEAVIKKLVLDEDVTKNSGIYYYLFDGKEKHLGLRSFPDSIKLAKHTEQDGVCANCKNEVPYDDSHADHITPWSIGGKTILSNCQVLCAECNRRKSNI